MHANISQCIHNPGTFYWNKVDLESLSLCMKNVDVERFTKKLETSVLNNTSHHVIES